MAPETRYAHNGDVHLAYQVVGEGELDLVYVPAWLHQSEHMWAHPRVAAFMSRLASFSRLILFDRRGTGMSDPITGPVSLDEQMDDVLAVMDAAGSAQAAFLAQLEGGAMAALFAATHPERTRALVLYAPHARFAPAPGYEWASSPEDREAAIPEMQSRWGQGRQVELLSRDPDPELMRWFGRLERLAVPPGVIPFIQRSLGCTDVRPVLGSIRAPTLVLHRTADQQVDVRHSRYVAAHVPGARLVELPGDETVLAAGRSSDVLDEAEEFLTGSRRPPQSDRVLATVLFTDIVGSTSRAARLGDRAWRELLGRHDDLVRGEVARFRGRLVKSLGDGWLATFDGPARAVRAALAARDGLRGLGLEIRAGLHTGECEMLGDDVGGIAVAIAARAQACAEPGEVIATSTVRDLVVGSGLEFAERGVRELKGVPGTWHLLAAAG